MNRRLADTLLPDPYSSHVRPALFGQRAAVSAAHPLAASAALEIAALGGGAADVVIAAQAVTSVLMPEAGGVGGDGFFLIRGADGTVTAVNAAGNAPADFQGVVADDGTSVTVPGVVAGWGELSARFGKVPLAVALAPAVRIAEEGTPIRAETLRAVASQRARLVRGGSEHWPFFATETGQHVRQPALAATLEAIGRQGAQWFYEGEMAAAVASAVAAQGGALTSADMAAHASVVDVPLSLDWKGLRIHVQPPMSQGVLLLMALAAYDKLEIPADGRDHASVELTQAAFAFRNEISRGKRLLEEPLPIDLARASLRGGPRSYLHTAGAAAADKDGVVVSSLISVFDDFGSAILVPEGGFMLNNRAAGFTQGSNTARPGAMPVHTLAPILVEAGDVTFALATPGADGQVQTLLQILVSLVEGGCDLPMAIDRFRWRSEDGKLLIEGAHPARGSLTARGHPIVDTSEGDTRFGAVVSAGFDGVRPFCCSDWRRETWSSAV